MDGTPSALGQICHAKEKEPVGDETEIIVHYPKLVLHKKFIALAQK